MSDTNARLWHRWLRINRVLRAGVRNARLPAISVGAAWSESNAPKVHRAEVSMRKITTVLAFLLLAMAELAVAQNNTQVRFRNIGSQSVTVVTEIGPKKISIFVPIDPGKSEIIYVGYGSLSWCAYKGGDATPCKPASPATGGAQIDVR